MDPRDLIVESSPLENQRLYDDIDDNEIYHHVTNHERICRFTLGKGNKEWVLGQNFFHGYSTVFDLKDEKMYIGVNQCHPWDWHTVPFKRSPYQYALSEDDYPMLGQEMEWMRMNEMKAEVSLEGLTLPPPQQDAPLLPTIDGSAALMMLCLAGAGIGVSFVFYHLLSSKAPAKKEIRLTNGRNDARTVSAKEIEALPREEREALKSLLLAGINRDSNNLM